ncbi:hypothetical protein EYD45_02695 [Hyunsoonleella flava]|uniref:Uncharacterized protein n=1 Tax=Hyunsoonleella flava TaxID=2527939 RepID=A0A4Q9FII2_9FLAO|nr:hypothetical protein [Hyunsoonleella flava]TBN06812.1 hypothetical protein EYD45_02695 [Hyunsoonleella flava]
MSENNNEELIDTLENCINQFQVLKGKLSLEPVWAILKVLATKDKVHDARYASLINSKKSGGFWTDFISTLIINNLFGQVLKKGVSALLRTTVWTEKIKLEFASKAPKTRPLLPPLSHVSRVPLKSGLEVSWDKTIEEFLGKRTSTALTNIANDLGKHSLNHIKNYSSFVSANHEPGIYEATEIMKKISEYYKEICGNAVNDIKRYVKIIKNGKVYIPAAFFDPEIKDKESNLVFYKPKINLRLEIKEWLKVYNNILELNNKFESLQLDLKLSAMIWSIVLPLNLYDVKKERILITDTTIEYGDSGGGPPRYRQLFIYPPSGGLILANKDRDEALINELFKRFPYKDCKVLNRTFKETFIDDEWFQKQTEHIKAIYLMKFFTDMRNSFDRFLKKIKKSTTKSIPKGLIASIDGLPEF